MTEFYVPQSAEGFEFCHPERQEDFETLNVAIDGAPKQEAWRSPPMHLVREDEGKALAESDSPWLGSQALIFRRQVVDKLGALLRQYGELLPLACPDADLVVFNVTRVVDALDEHASSILRFSDGRAMRILRYAFRTELVAGVDIFKIPNLRVCPTFVSERIVQAWTSAGLRGLDFSRVWSG